MLLTLIVQ